jgi:hypothetical protein
MAMAMSQDFVSNPERRSPGGNVRRADWRQWVQPMKRLLALGVVALAIASCSVPERASSETVPFAVSPSVAVAAAPTTTSTPDSTSTTADAVTTTLPATTTTVATEDLIKQAVQNYSAAYHSCGVEPAACVPGSFTAVQGRSRATITELATGMANQGLYFSTDLRGSYIVAESIIVGSPTKASATYCIFDAGAVMGPLGPDGVPTVVNDVVASVRYSFDLFLEDGLWRVGEQHQTERLGEGSLCPPAT